eukprot:434619-Pelagomonas_calceolata.AAC.2
MVGKVLGPRISSGPPSSSIVTSVAVLKGMHMHACKGAAQLKLTLDILILPSKCTLNKARDWAACFA